MSNNGRIRVELALQVAEQVRVAVDSGEPFRQPAQQGLFGFEREEGGADAAPGPGGADRGERPAELPGVRRGVARGQALHAAGLVLVLMNVATIFPLWPGNVGLVQAAVALPLFTYYGVARARGIAFGFGLQAIEASVGIGVGLIFLAREGLSVAMLLELVPDLREAA